VASGWLPYFAHALALAQVIGFAFGPQVFGPLSELYGRKFPLVLGIFLSAIFNIPTATAPNLATIMISRFFAGVFGAAPYAIAGGCFHDMLDPVHVQIGVAFFAVSTAGGPALGPVVGAGLVSTGSDGWRWVGW
jgi:MFS family permease